MSHTNEAADIREQEQELQEQEEKLEELEQTAPAGASEAEVNKQLADENYQKLLRVQADYDNFRRRSRLEKEEFAKYASQKLIEQLLPIYDNFDRALIAGKDTVDAEAFTKGIEMIFRQFSAVLESEGVTAIEALGQPFDPEFHQAVMKEESPDHEEGIVIEELQKGYRMKDKVIRPSMVKVSS